MTKITEEIRDEARKELVRRLFWKYCQFRYPKLYKDDRLFLKELCDKIQAFMEQSYKKFLIINMPPRHLKSLTATNLVEWLFGLDTMLKVITGSYNETLSTTFASKVRDTIDQRRSRGGGEVYNDIFPKTKIQLGKSSKSLWGLEGSSQDNYLATSPTGTSTGFGAHVLLIDDIVKNAKEAFNQTLLEEHARWFTDTMMSRLEGDDWKVIAIMTRWAKGDLSGVIIDKYGDLVEVIQFKAVQDDGSMLCDEILSHESYKIKTQEMSREIIAANYNQIPIDVQGKLYSEFYEWEKLPEAAKEAKVWNYTDTADKGVDWLCSVSYVVVNDEVYILDVVMSDESMEKTEPLVVDMLQSTNTLEAIIEANNGGRGFGRNLERLLKETYGNIKCLITDKNQSSNKEARILSSAAWVQRHVYMPPNWKSKHKDFHNQLFDYMRKGKNEHDDAPDVLAGIYEKVANTEVIDYAKWKVS